MVEVALSIGSNVERYLHINLALDALELQFGSLLQSTVYESEAVGFKGNSFLNLVVIINTCESLSQLILCLKAIEDSHGRDRSQHRFSSRTLDIDVITYGECCGELEGVTLPRPELFKNAFVLLPLVALWPNRKIPGCYLTYRNLWQEMNVADQALHPVDFIRRRFSIA